MAKDLANLLADLEEVQQDQRSLHALEIHLGPSIFSHGYPLLFFAAHGMRRIGYAKYIFPVQPRVP